MGAARDLNTTAAAMKILHAARQVDRLAPQIIDEFLATNDAGDHGTRIDFDPERELTATWNRRSAMTACISSARLTRATAWSGLGHGTPEATM